MILSVLSIIPSIFGWYKAKQEAQMRLYEIVWDGTKILVRFALKHARIILIGLMLGYCLLKINALNRAKIQAENALLSLKTDIAKQAEKRRIENTIKHEQGVAAAAILAATHKNDMIAIMLRSNQTIRKAQDENKILNRDVNNWRERVRLEVASKQLSTGLPENDTDRLTSADGDATIVRRIQTLEQAGAVCAADYNMCHDYVKAEQARVGVYE